jgi:hypothetical protein
MTVRNRGQERSEGEEGKKRDINGRMATRPTESGESIIANKVNLRAERVA